MKNLKRLQNRFISLLLVTLLACTATTIMAQDSSYHAKPQQVDTVIQKMNTDDGPHVFWQDDNTAIVFYYCNDEIESQTYTVSDTLRFSGFCSDKDREYVITAVPPKPGPDNISDAGRLIAISDIHGDYEHFLEILIASEVVDSNLHWTWGNGHLVIDGDVFDRGEEVTECLWLIHQLEREATVVGGAVHFLLGNHELMVLRGDLRYVHERYTKGISKRSRFANNDLFGPETELGRWLRTKHTVIRINRTLFVHGGLRSEFLLDGKTFSDVNDAIRSGLDHSSTRLRFDDLVKRFFGSYGPFWYRGYTCGIEGRYEPLTTVEIDSVLALCDVDEIVVGHSQQDSIITYHDGKIIAIDIVVEEMDGQRALLWQDGKFYRVSQKGMKQLLITE